MDKEQLVYKELTEAIIENDGVVCEQAPDAFFFEEEYKDDNYRYKINTAKVICAECPVKLLCLQYALESRQPYGIWGGLTWPERKKLIRGGGNEIIHRGNTRGAER